MGVEQLSDRVKEMFSREFAQTIGSDAEKSESVFESFEISRDKLVLGDELGKGAFGVVHKATYKQGTKDRVVAAKTLHSDSSNDELTKFLMEARLMSLLSHPNLLELVAVCTKETPFYIVTEFMAKGDLKQLLRDSRPHLPSRREKIELMDLHLMTVQIADAMTFLEFKHVIHRDLAARNVLVGDGNIVKLADFGMSRNVEADYYKKTSDDRVPVKWMAPESIADRIYTSQSDVWSFGILMWEVYSYAKAPYAEYSAIETVAAVAAGYRLPRPDICPENIYSLMLRSWQFHGKDRVTFTQIMAELEAVDLNKAFTQNEKQVEKPKSTQKSKAVSLIEVDGYVADEKTAFVKPTPGSIEIEDGYVADVQQPPPRPKKDPSLAAPITEATVNSFYGDGKPLKKNALYIQDSQLTHDNVASTTAFSAPSGMLRSDPSNHYIQDTSLYNMQEPTVGKPQLRASRDQYIDTNTLVPFVPSMQQSGFYPVQAVPANAGGVSRPQLRAGNSAPAAMPQQLDLLTLLASIGLHHYVPLFLGAGIAMVDSFSASQFTDFYLQQLGIFDPTHRYLILSSIMSFVQSSYTMAPTFNPAPASGVASSATKLAHIPNPKPAMASKKNQVSASSLPATAEVDNGGNADASDSSTASAAARAAAARISHHIAKPAPVSKIQLPTFGKTSSDDDKTVEQLNDMYRMDAEAAKKKK